MAFAARVPTVIWQGARGQLAAAGLPLPQALGWGLGCKGAVRGWDAPSPSPFFAKDPAPTGCEHAKEKDSSLNPFLLSNRNQTASWKTTPLPPCLASAQTPGSQELPRAPRLQHRVDMYLLGSDMALGHSEALETASGWRALARPSPRPVPSALPAVGASTGLVWMNDNVESRALARTAGCPPAHGGRAESSLGCSEPALGEPEEG